VLKVKALASAIWHQRLAPSHVATISEQGEQHEQSGAFPPESLRAAWRVTSRHFFGFPRFFARPSRREIGFSTVELSNI
jgi:hypothetical protein